VAIFFGYPNGLYLGDTCCHSQVDKWQVCHHPDGTISEDLKWHKVMHHVTWHRDMVAADRAVAIKKGVRRTPLTTDLIGWIS